MFRNLVKNSLGLKKSQTVNLDQLYTEIQEEQNDSLCIEEKNSEHKCSDSNQFHDLIKALTYIYNDDVNDLANLKRKMDNLKINRQIAAVLCFYRFIDVVVLDYLQKKIKFPLIFIDNIPANLSDEKKSIYVIDHLKQEIKRIFEIGNALIDLSRNVDNHEKDVVFKSLQVIKNYQSNDKVLNLLLRYLNEGKHNDKTTHSVIGQHENLARLMLLDSLSIDKSENRILPNSLTNLIWEYARYDINIIVALLECDSVAVQKVQNESLFAIILIAQIFKTYIPQIKKQLESLSHTTKLVNLGEDLTCIDELIDLMYILVQFAQKQSLYDYQIQDLKKIKDAFVTTQEFKLTNPFFQNPQYAPHADNVNGIKTGVATIKFIHKQSDLLSQLSLINAKPVEITPQLNNFVNQALIKISTKASQ